MAASWFMSGPSADAPGRAPNAEDDRDRSLGASEWSSFSGLEPPDALALSYVFDRLRTSRFCSAALVMVSCSSREATLLFRRLLPPISL